MSNNSYYDGFEVVIDVDAVKNGYKVMLKPFGIEIVAKSKPELKLLLMEELDALIGSIIEVK